MNDGDARVQSEVAVFSLLERGLRELGFSHDRDQIQRLCDLVFLLSHWAQRINLTGHRGPMEMTTRLVLDAAALSVTVPELASFSRLADLGSGAGFPGLPIAILWPQLDVHLVDSRLKRHHFQREACRKLDLSRVHPVLGRSDEVDSIPCDISIAQAMTRPERAFELMIPWVKPGGLAVLPASDRSVRPPTPREIENLEQRTYEVPGSGTLRKLWVARLRGG